MVCWAIEGKNALENSVAMRIDLTFMIVVVINKVNYFR